MEVKGTSLFVKALQREGVNKVFGYPGSYVIDIFDELYQQNQIELIIPRHEQALVHEADGYARSTGKIGVCLVTSGPGATNLVTGIATANYDSVPLVCFTGQVPIGLIGNDAFQEVDIIGITRGICKYGVSVRDRKDLGRIIKEAFYIAGTGKPGPVIVDLPKDIMIEYGDDIYPDQVNIRGYKPITNVHLGQIKKAIQLLESANKPIILAGGGIHIAGAREEFKKLAEILQIPVVTTIMGKGALPTNHPLYIGNIGMHGSYAANIAVSECDVLFSIGTRFNDRITGKINEFAQNAKIIHIDIDSASISRNVNVDIPIVADAKLAIQTILGRVKACKSDKWIKSISELKRNNKINTVHQGISPSKIIQEINTCFTEAIIVTDVGQHQMWTMQNLEMNENKKLITSGGLGTMGYGFPAAIGAKLGNPEQTVICITGDGGFQMNMQEMATAMAQQLPIIICIMNNGYLGMVRQWQELFYSQRYSGTCMKYRKNCSKNCLDLNKECPPYLPDFMKFAESYGALGIRVAEEGSIGAALDKAVDNLETPTIIEFIIDSNYLVLPMVRSGKAISDMITNLE